MSTRKIAILGHTVQLSQAVLFALIIAVYLVALFALPSVIEPVIMGLPFWAWLAIALILIHYALVYKFIQDYRDLDQVVIEDG